MTRLAGLPMYDFAEISSATHAFWQALYNALRERGVSECPLTLSQPKNLPQFWSDTSLILGQTCGYPFMFGLCGHARYVATPHYSTRFSKGARHKSVIIVRNGSSIQKLSDAQGKTCAINMADSNTGMNLLRLEIAKQKPQSPFFSHVYETHAHRSSIAAVATGEADIASIDCVTFALVEKIDPSLAEKVIIIGETEETPNLPFITSSETDDRTLALLRDALMFVINSSSYRHIMKVLKLDGLSILPVNAYERVKEIETQAIKLGYPTLI